MKPKTDAEVRAPFLLRPRVYDVLLCAGNGLRHLSLFFCRDFELIEGLFQIFHGEGIEDFTFHDLRHTAINNWRLQGHDYYRIMAASGHKTMHVFKRYNTVSKDELKSLVGENR